MLNGQQLQGPHTAEEVNFMLKNKDMEDKYISNLWQVHLIIVNIYS